MRIAIVGGDERMLRLARLCAERGHEMQTLGLTSGDDRAFDNVRTDLLALAYPCTVREGKIPCLTGLELTPEQVMKRVTACACVVAGSGWPDAAARLYTADEVFLKANAELSAEGALCTAMNRRQKALWGARCLIVGYGRLGRALALKLTALGAWVVVAARREDARTQARRDGMRACAVEELPAAAPRTDFLFNTVPAHVFPQGTLEALPLDCLLMDLASAPYGWEDAQGRESVRLPAIPARYAPLSAAEALYDALMRLGKEAQAT